MRNSVCKYIRNSAEFPGIPGNFTAKNTAEFRGISRNSVCFSKNSVFRRKSKTHFRGHPSRNPLICVLLAHTRLLPERYCSHALLPLPALFAAHLSCPELPGLRLKTSLGINEDLPVLKALISHSVTYHVHKVC